MRHRTVQKAVQPAAGTWLYVRTTACNTRVVQAIRTCTRAGGFYREPGRLYRGPGRAVPEKKIIVFSPSDDSIVR